MPEHTSVHVSQHLTNVAIAWFQDEGMFGARKVAPYVPVAKETGKYFVFNRGDAYRDEADERAPGTLAPEFTWRATTATYTCARVSARTKLDDPTRANWDIPLAADESMTKQVAQKISIKEEVKFASAYMTTSKWGTDITGKASNPSTNEVLQWDVSTSVPVKDVRDGSRSIQTKTGKKANVMACGQAVVDTLSVNAQMLDLYKHTQAGPVTEELMAKAFNLDEIVVFGATKNSANEGQTASYSLMVGSVALLAHVTKSPAKDEPSAAYIFGWDEMDDAKAVGAPQIKKYREEGIETDWFEGNSYKDFKLIDQDLGYFFTAIVG